MGYTTILLDADGTLLDFEAAQREAFFAAMRRMKVPAGEEMLARYDRINHTQWKRLERGEVTREAMLAERYALLFAEWGLERDPQAANRAYGDALAESAPLLPGARELLEALSPVAYLAIITNGVPHSQHRCFALSGIDRYVRQVLISGEVGCEKPDPRFFRAALERCGAPDPREVLVVGDSISADIAGAAAAGLDSCWFNPKGTPLPAGVMPTYLASDLREVAALVYRSQQRSLPFDSAEARKLSCQA